MMRASLRLSCAVLSIDQCGGHQAYDATAINLKGSKAIVNFKQRDATYSYSLHKRRAGSSKYHGVSYYKKVCAGRRGG